MLAPLIGVVPVFALSFSGYAYGQRIQKKNDSDRLTLVNPPLHACGKERGGETEGREGRRRGGKEGEGEGRWRLGEGKRREG